MNNIESKFNEGNWDTLYDLSINQLLKDQLQSTAAIRLNGYCSTSIKWLRMIIISTSIGDGHCGSGQGGFTETILQRLQQKMPQKVLELEFL